jgi:hypothetical protein
VALQLDQEPQGDHSPPFGQQDARVVVVVIVIGRVVIVEMLEVDTFIVDTGIRAQRITPFTTCTEYPGTQESLGYMQGER